MVPAASLGFPSQGEVMPLQLISEQNENVLPASKSAGGVRNVFIRLPSMILPIFANEKNTPVDMQADCD
jgi:hypothetical protein